MERYYFLFALALIWIVFATIQDLRKREVANWINFSLVSIALAYRAFYSSYSGQWDFFLFGVIALIGFFVVANVFYYSRIFAGGDAKLLIALGVVLPYNSYYDLGFISFLFVFLLLFCGLIYSLIYSVFLVYRNWGRFVKEFKREVKSRWFFFVISVGFAIISLFLVSDLFLSTVAVLVLIGLPVLWFYILSLDACMVGKVNADKLTEGDWLQENVRVGNKTIRKSVHGLSFEDIKLLKRYKKSVLIKQGIPFVPAFLISFVIMVFFSLTLLESLRILSLSLLQGF